MAESDVYECLVFIVSRESTTLRTTTIASPVFCIDLIFNEMSTLLATFSRPDLLHTTATLFLPPSPNLEIKILLEYVEVTILVKRKKLHEIVIAHA